MRRIWFRIHSFTGVVTGLLLFVICWSGTFATVSKELEWLVTPPARVVAGDNTLTWGEIVHAVENEYPLATVTGLERPLYRTSSTRVYVDFQNEEYATVFVNQHTGEVVGKQSGFDIPRFFRSLHMGLFIPEISPVSGILVVSLFSITLIVSLIGALFFYRRWWTRFFEGRWRDRSGRIAWSDLHKILGLWGLWFSLLIGLTGAWYLFETVRGDYGDGRLNYSEAEDGNGYVYDFPEAHVPSGALPVDEIIRTAESAYPELEIERIHRYEGVWTIEGQAGYMLVRDRSNHLVIDEGTAEVIYKQTTSDYSLYWRWSDTADPLHFGDFAGLVSKLIWFVFGLLLSGLILTGVYLHAKRLIASDRSRNKHRWAATTPSLFVSLIVAASTIPLGIYEAWLYYAVGTSENRSFPQLSIGTYSIVIGWVSATVFIIYVWTKYLIQASRITATATEVPRPVQ